jgi:hypothetical protein
MKHGNTFLKTPKNMRALKRGAKRVNIYVSVRKKKHPLRVRVMQTDAHRMPTGDVSLPMQYF